MSKDVYLLEGERWLRISRAAALLRTSAAAIRKRMAEGSLEWRQSRVGSTIFVVSEKQVLELRAGLSDEKRRPLQRRTGLPKMLEPADARRDPSLPATQRGGAFFEHHLRLTLPRDKKGEV